MYVFQELRLSILYGGFFQVSNPTVVCGQVKSLKIFKNFKQFFLLTTADQSTSAVQCCLYAGGFCGHAIKLTWICTWTAQLNESPV
ncbi:hypothetical protein QR680_003315 [Steinernema hermaphroditum]|uniref:Uncharacterized protein n=1 Tax=Steinernema hermaphroditum TaxID=289476 RepID=A0AA39LK47_9BILA|nr:hypothetical protein QR680_003315 [Steinernema hermaphroditum]